jgi:hypothetical protein
MNNPIDPKDIVNLRGCTYIRITHGHRYIGANKKDDLRSLVSAFWNLNATENFVDLMIKTLQNINRLRITWLLSFIAAQSLLRVYYEVLCVLDGQGTHCETMASGD